MIRVGSGRPQVSFLSIGGGKSADGDSRQLETDVFREAGLYNRKDRKVLVPPLGEGSLRVLGNFVDESNILRQCINAYETNIDGFGHVLDMVVDEEEFPGAKSAEAKLEASRLDEFFQYAYSSGSFVDLRRKTRHDIEATGVGYWEVIRDPKGQIIRLEHIPSHTMRMTALDPEAQTVIELRQVGIEQKPVKVSKRFRVFCQISDSAGKQETIWFREFGDPRVLDYKTGEWKSSGDRKNAATEVIVFRSDYHPTSPYALPRWIGNLPSVLGSRASEEINVLYFDNKTVPPLVIMVSGGQLTKGSIKRLEHVLNHEIKGRENFHKALVLEAVSTDEAAMRGTSTAPKIEIKPLTEAQLSDAMFQAYDQNNRKKLRSSFRLAPIFTGESDDYTRATAEVSMLVVEEQVFRPERLAFDYFLNRWLMPALGAHYWKFKSLGPNVTLNEDLIAALGAAEGVGAMTPNLGREILSDVLEKELPKIEEPWGDIPYSLTLAQTSALFGMGFGAGLEGDEAGTPTADDAEAGQKRAAMALWARRLPPQVKKHLLRQLVAEARLELARRGRKR
jgi:PBSX family phage portal protein